MLRYERLQLDICTFKLSFKELNQTTSMHVQEQDPDVFPFKICCQQKKQENNNIRMYDDLTI